MNQLINLIILDKLQGYKSPKSMSIRNLDQLNHKYTNHQLALLNKSFADLADAINVLSRKFNNGYSNLNQLAHRVNSGKVNLDPKVLSNYKQLVKKSMIDMNYLSKEATNVWLKI